jgi:hypothetical protein
MKQRPRFFGTVSIPTRMLRISVPLLAMVGFIATSGEAAKTSTHDLNYVRTQRGPRLYADGRAMGS